jgi:hypothetical protein
MQGKKQIVDIHMTAESLLSWFYSYKDTDFEYYHIINTNLASRI